MASKLMMHCETCKMFTDGVAFSTAPWFICSVCQPDAYQEALYFTVHSPERVPEEPEVLPTIHHLEDYEF